ncbi:hypothetical protein QVD17_41996 [Tagetes erecta]|uniref:Uncharacterized protein n=1 Tax=Tagetes erecta TaxID=13708 RepID=A0AAD8NE08_TARER|nr:hypothetical protein QVD17_41996 [Tagetes erecta]
MRFSEHKLKIYENASSMDSKEGKRNRSEATQLNQSEKGTCDRSLFVRQSNQHHSGTLSPEISPETTNIFSQLQLDKQGTLVNRFIDEK